MAAEATLSHIGVMSVNDTSRAVQELLSRRYAEMSFAEKAERLRAVTLAANLMTLAGLRVRHPDFSEGELL